MFPIRAVFVSGVLWFAAAAHADQSTPKLSTKRECKRDNDCLSLLVGCCTSRCGGVPKSKARAFKKEHLSRCAIVDCTAPNDDDGSCTRKPICEAGQCTIPTPIECQNDADCGITKDLMNDCCSNRCVAIAKHNIEELKARTMCQVRVNPKHPCPPDFPDPTCQLTPTCQKGTCQLTQPTPPIPAAKP